MLALILFFMLTTGHYTLDDDRACKSLDWEFSILWIRGFRHPIPRLHFPSLISVYHTVLCTTRYLLLHRSSDITSALHLQGACTRGGVGVALYTITRESMTSPGTEDRKSILREKDTRLGGPSSRGPIYRCSRARRTGERRPKLTDRVAASGELMGRPRSVVRERD